MRASSDVDDIIVTSPVIEVEGVGVGSDDAKMGVAWKAGLLSSEGVMICNGIGGGGCEVASVSGDDGVVSKEEGVKERRGGGVHIEWVGCTAANGD